MAVYGQYADTLTKLGLTLNEAKVYLSTFRTGIATAKVIAKNAEIAREDVYRILPSLQEKGLIKKHIGSPARFEATTPDDAMKILLTQREQENEQLRNQADHFLFLCNNGQHTNDNEDEKTVVVSRDNASGIDSELIRLVKKINHNLDFTTRYKLFSLAFNEPGLTEWINEMYKAAERGIKFRMIMDATDNIMPMCQRTFSILNSKRLLMHPNFSFRYVSKVPECVLIQFDNQACCIETACLKEHKMSPYMITNNPVFVALSKAYFELLWNQALKEEQWNGCQYLQLKERKHTNTKNNASSQITTHSPVEAQRGI